VSAIEIETFTLRHAVSDETFLALDEQLLAWSYLHRAGLQRRTTARGLTNRWLVETWWENMDHAELRCEGELFAQWRELMEPSNYERQLFRTLD
jgi:hypothetical protein